MTYDEVIKRLEAIMCERNDLLRIRMYELIEDLKKAQMKEIKVTIDNEFTIRDKIVDQTKPIEKVKEKQSDMDWIGERIAEALFAPTRELNDFLLRDLLRDIKNESI